MGGTFGIIAAGITSSGGFGMVRYDLDGSLDGAFAAAIVSLFSDNFRPDQVAIESDGSILVAGYTNSGSSCDLAVAHYMTNGALDASFGAGGGATAGLDADETYPCGLAVTTDGSILLTGTANISGSSTDTNSP